MSNTSAEIKEFDRCINALALELPESVWSDVNKRWNNFKSSLCQESVNILVGKSKEDCLREVFNEWTGKTCSGEQWLEYLGKDSIQLTLAAMEAYASRPSTEGNEDELWEDVHREFSGKYYINGKRTVSAMRFFDSQNTRIYCQEMADEQGQFFIICAKVFGKKSQRNDKKNRPILKNIADNDYTHKR